VTARFAHWTDHAQAVAVSASVMPTSAGRLVSPTDLAIGLLRYEHGNVAQWWRGCGFDLDRAIAALHISPAIGPPRRDVRFDDETRRVLDAAIRAAASAGANQVGTEHILAALVNHGPSGVVEAFAAQGVTPQSVLAYLARTGGGPGVERLPVRPGRQARRAWRHFQGSGTPRRSRQIWLPITAVIALVAVFVVISML
jgi:ATP-dependent Clp protease ATP-binding subunit ClpA